MSQHNNRDNQEPLAGIVQISFGIRISQPLGLSSGHFGTFKTGIFDSIPISIYHRVITWHVFELVFISWTQQTVSGLVQYGAAMIFAAHCWRPKPQKVTRPLNKDMHALIRFHNFSTLLFFYIPKSKNLFQYFSTAYAHLKQDRNPRSSLVYAYYYALLRAILQSS